MGYFVGVKCDVCGTAKALDANKEIVTIWAREKGWKVGKYCTCPECVKKIEAAKKRK